MANSENDIKLRKYEDSLSITGIGIMLFTVWSLVRLALSISFADDYFGISEYDGFVQAVCRFAIVLVLSVDIFLRLKVGFDAYREGRGKMSGKLYMVISLLVFIPMSILSIYSYCREFSAGTTGTLSQILVEITSLITTIEMLHSAIMVKKLKKLSEGE